MVSSSGNGCLHRLTFYARCINVISQIEFIIISLSNHCLFNAVQAELRASKMLPVPHASLSKLLCVSVFVYQECNRWGLARDHVIMFESQSLWRAIGVPWEGVRQWFCLLLLCLLHLPLFLPGQCWNTPTCSHSNCWSVICFVRWSLGPTEELTFIWFCAQKVAQWRDTVTTHMTNWWL